MIVVSVCYKNRGATARYTEIGVLFFVLNAFNDQFPVLLSTLYLFADLLQFHNRCHIDSLLHAMELKLQALVLGFEI